MEQESGVIRPLRTIDFLIIEGTNLLTLLIGKTDQEDDYELESTSADKLKEWWKTS